MPSLLTEYGIEIPEKIAVPLSQQVVFPGEKNEGYLAVTFSEITPSITGAFCPGHDVSLKIASTVTFCQLFKLVHDLDEFLSPIKENLDLLIYFFLHKSAIFDTYLRYQLRKHSGQTQESPPSMQAAVSRAYTMSGTFLNSIRRSSEPFKGISWDILAVALKETKELVAKLVEGTAQYNDVTADGNLPLEKIDLVVEFKVLVDYAQYLNPTSNVTLCQLFNLVHDLYELLSPIQENLLSMHIPGLFAMESVKNDPAAQGVPLYFKTMLREYIQRNRLADLIIDYFTTKWVSIHYTKLVHCCILNCQSF